jgi:RHS repeat-associated protein
LRVGRELCGGVVPSCLVLPLEGVMGRRRFPRGVRRLMPVFVLVAALGLLAGVLPSVLASPSGGGGGGGLSIQAAGSNGSVHSLPWWDPRGWFGGGDSGAPSSKVLDDNVAAVPRAGRLPKQQALGPVRRVRELAAKRTEYSRTYELSDGKLQTAISSGPVNYQTASGRWAPISTTVRRSSRPGYVFQNVTNTFGSYFGSSAGQLVRFDAPGGGWLAVGLSGARVGQPEVSGDTVTYADVEPGVSLSYEVTPQSLVERFTLASSAAAKSLPSLHFVIKTGGGLVPQAQKNGSITLSRGAAPVLVLPAPFMTDSRAESSSPYGYAWSPKVSQTATWDKATSTMGVSLSADAGWLDAAARKYPVVVDPTISVAPTPTDAQNTMIISDPGEDSENFSTDWRLSVGTDSAGDDRALLSFPIGAVPAGTQLDSADLELYYDQTFGPGTADQTINAYAATSSWSASTATWDNANNIVGTEGENQVTVDDSDTADTSSSGAWPTASSSDAIDGEYAYNQGGSSGQTFTWVPPLTESGAYQVGVHYVASSSAASDAPYTVNYDGGSASYTVNQQSGSGGQWATLGTQDFAAGNTGSVVLGNGPASSSTMVEADAVQLTKFGSVTVNPNVDNIWNSYSVRNIVQSWIDGASPNDGFVLKAADESTLDVGGPRYEASLQAYNGETATYPQLVLTYGAPGVTPDPVTTIHATGAVLNWQPYVNNTGDPGMDLDEYQVYRSVFQSFVPASNTLVAPVPAGTTTFTDTTNTPTPPGGLGNAFYYMIAVKTTDGTIIPGPVQLVRLPTAGSTTQIIDATGATTLSSAEPTTNEEHITGQPWLEVGDDSATFGTTRSIVNFPSMAAGGIPSDASITSADLKMWGFLNDDNGGSTYDAYELTQPFDPATATWDDASSGTAWTTAGGSIGASPLSQITGLTNDPDREEWDVTSAAQDWLATPSDEDGLLVKLDSSAIAERELFLDTSAPEQALAPELVVTYTEPTAQDTYYSPSLPSPMTSGTSYTVPVTLTNTTSSTWPASDWVLSYHWLTPDGTDVSTSSDQAQTALPADMAPSSVQTINATVEAPDTSGSGDARAGYEIAWDLYDTATGDWLSSGTSTPALTASAVQAARERLAAKTTAKAGVRAAASSSSSVVATLNQNTSIEDSSSNMLGLENYYQYTGVNTGSGTSLLNNDDTGNVVWNYNAFSNPSRGFQTFVRMDYNSMDTSESSMGFGWSLQASTLQRLGTPLEFHPPGNPTSVTLTDGDGTTHVFTLDSSTGQWVAPPGLHYFLQDNSADCSANGKDPVSDAWTMTAPDGTVFDFDCNGYQTSVTDRNGNTSTFTYTQSNSNNSPTEFLDYITDSEGRQTLTISYYQKGQDYSYIDDSTGDVESGTGLTDPDIIGQVASITDISGREITFLYDTKGLMEQMTDGAGTSVAKTFKFAYDMTQGNKNVKLVSVTNPDGNTTNLAYYTAPEDPTFKWSLNTITDPMSRTTSFAYTEPSSGGIQAQVTDPKSNVTTYTMDSQGRPVQSVNALNQTTNLAWDSDNNVISLTEPNGAQTTWTYDPNTGYPLTMTDAQANHDGTAGYTYTYDTSDDGHIAEIASELTPQQRLWTFGYDTNGNLTSVTEPLGNASGAAAGSYTSKYTYDSSGDLLTSTDPDGNTTTYSDYDPTGYPDMTTDALNNTTTYTYDSIGDVTAVTDPMQNTSTYTYDVFGRPLQSVVPKTSTVSITTPAPVYDGDDNVLQSTAPNGAVTTYTYDADDELSSQVTTPDTSSDPAPTTTYTYDADGNPASETAPDGNVPGATAGSYTTTYGYDAINEETSVTDALGGVTKYGYDDAGNQVSTTDPDGNQTQAEYNLNHQVIQTTDAAGNTTKTGYDLDGNVTSTADQNGNVTQYTLDADGDVTQEQVPAQAPGAPVSYDTTQYVYDQDGNQTEVISPRGVASGISGAYTTQTKYTADNQVSSVQTPYLPGDPTYGTPAETDYTYNADGELSSVSAPPSGNQSIRQVTNYGYYDNGWTQSETDPTGITTSYDYNALGEQSSRVLTSAGGAMSRTMSWDYYPDGNLSSISDDGVPTGLYAEVIDDSDTNNTSQSGAWTTESCTSTTSGCEEYEYQEHAAGTGSDSFTWDLNAPESGNYTVYVKYPVVSGAATDAQYTVSYNGGSSTATVSEDQTQDNSGNWISLGSYALTAGAKNQTVSLAENSGGTVVAGAVEIVRDNSSDTNTATHAYSYTYDADGNQTGITDTSNQGNGNPSTAVTNYAMAYDQDDRNTSVTEDNSSGTAVHTTTYGYDAASNLISQVHDGAPSSYAYNDLNQLKTETDATSSTDTDPQVTSFTYNPTGQVATEAKPNGNTVTSTYYANDLLYQQTEDTSGGTLVSSHQYSYDPDGDTTQDVEQLQSADNSADYLDHTLTYTYDPMDQVDTVATDGTVTESYTHDADNDVTAQTVDGTTTDYGYNLGQLQTATTGGTTDDYNYDPIGRLDTVTSGGQTIESDTYDGFDNLTATSQLDPTTGSMDTTTYDYDSLNRVTSETNAAGTSSYSYLGLSSELASESDPGGESKTYDYTPDGQRLSQDITGGSGPTGYGYYSYNSHDDVEAVTGTTGTTTATYGYTAYGDPIQSMFTGADQNDATASPTSTTQPYSSYRFNAMRWDSSSGQYDMGFRNYDPSLNQFVSRDMYDGALADAGLTTDPFTGSRYAFGGGNPISNIEYNGHDMICGGEGICGSLQSFQPGGANYKAIQAQASQQTKASNGPQKPPHLVSVSKYVDVLSNDPELSALRQAWANYVASQRGTPFPATPEVQAMAWIAICSQHSGLCPGSFVAQENRIGTIGQFLPDPTAEVAILADAHGTQVSIPGLRLPPALLGMAATGNIGKLARQFGVSTRQIRSAIESVKQAGLPRGGPVRNPNVVVDEEGEVYPLGPGGVAAEDSIGNIWEYIEEEEG